MDIYMIWGGRDSCAWLVRLGGRFGDDVGSGWRGGVLVLGLGVLWGETCLAFMST